MEHVELFCEKLVVLVKGKAVINGYLKDIKKEYGKKNIIIRGNINKEEILKEKGVLNISKEKEDYIISVENIDIASKIFHLINKYDNITKFTIEDPSLNEIFIAKVGANYEK